MHYSLFFMKLKMIYGKLHFYLGNIWRVITIPMYQHEILLEECINIFGCSYGKKGWHHIVETLKQYDVDNEIHYKDTVLYDYLKYFKPLSIEDLIDSQQGKNKLPLFVFPWGTFKKGEYDSNKNPNSSRFCGPSTDEFICQEFQRIIYLYKKIKKEGYKPWSFGNGFISGTLLFNNVGGRRFIVLQGNHRLAIFSHLNYSRLKIRNCPGYIAALKEKQIQSWELVKSKRVKAGVALKIFQFYFNNNGEHIRSGNIRLRDYL